MQSIPWQSSIHRISSKEHLRGDQTADPGLSSLVSSPQLDSHDGCAGVATCCLPAEGQSQVGIIAPQRGRPRARWGGETGRGLFPAPSARSEHVLISARTQRRWQVLIVPAWGRQRGARFVQLPRMPTLLTVPMTRHGAVPGWHCATLTGCCQCIEVERRENAVARHVSKLVPLAGAMRARGAPTPATRTARTPRRGDEDPSTPGSPGCGTCWYPSQGR